MRNVAIAVDTVVDEVNQAFDNLCRSKKSAEYAISRIKGIAKPLASRLTAEEKEMVRKAYKSISEYGKDKSEECASCANYAARVWMNRIFGKELFERKEG